MLSVSLRVLISILAVALLVATPLVVAKTDPSGVIRILCVGESYYPETPLPLLLTSDPKVQYNPLPANMGEGTFTWGGPTALKRFVRIYIPRTYEDFLRAYDLVILSDYPAIFLEPEHYRWFERAIRDEGAGLGKYELNFGTSGASYPMDPWRSSAIYPAFPADLPDRCLPTSGMGVEPGRPPGGVRVEEHNLLVDLPGVSRYDLFGSGKFGLEIPRQTTKVIGWFKFTDIPAIMVSEYGRGRCESTVAGLDWMDPVAVRQWDFFPDFFLNQFYWLAGERIPPDLLLVNRIRGNLRDLQIKTQLILAVVDFIETFGASGHQLERDLTQVDGLRGEVRESYLKQEYSRAAELTENCLGLMRRIEGNSVQLKNRALMWIYLIEWSVVSGSAMICGLLLYTLMIRRRMYREVTVTKLSRQR